MEERSFRLGIEDSFYNDNLFKGEKANNKGYVLAKFNDLLNWLELDHCGLCLLG